MSTDVIDVTELNCADCGGSMIAMCREHGPQENATVRGSVLRCIEWDLASGDECWRVLQLSCEQCNSNDVEGL